jgi:hypothetical protein
MTTYASERQRLNHLLATHLNNLPSDYLSLKLDWPDGGRPGTVRGRILRAMDLHTPNEYRRSLLGKIDRAIAHAEAQRRAENAEMEREGAEIEFEYAANRYAEAAKRYAEFKRDAEEAKAVLAEYHGEPVAV